MRRGLCADGDGDGHGLTGQGVERGDGVPVLHAAQFGAGVDEFQFVAGKGAKDEILQVVLSCWYGRLKSLNLVTGHAGD